jgi:AcrR family transcriptional regulator
LRDEHSLQTKERLVAAAIEYLDSHEADTLTLHRMAELANVSAPTVYAHFPTMDALYLGVFQWLRPRLKLRLDEYPSSLSGLPEMPRIHFPAFAKYGRALSALLESPGFHRARRSDRADRHGGWMDLVARELPGLGDEERRLAAFAVNAFWTPSMWHWLSETCGLNTEQGARVASWAIGSLVEALKRDPSGLTRMPAQEVSSKRQKGGLT